MQRERVKVFARLRPMPSTAEAPTAVARSSCVTPGSAPGSVQLSKDDGDTRQYAFDGFFDPSSQQQELYEAAAQDIVERVLEGYNGTVFAYGQTGSGKTHTMLGPPSLASGAPGSLASMRPGAVRPSTAATAAATAAAEAGEPLPDILLSRRVGMDPNDGIIPRALADLFHRVATDGAHVYDVSVSYVQIYCELIHDLLNPDSGVRSLTVRESADGGVYVDGAARFKVADPAACLELLAQGHLNRAQASTRMNAHSSRSHAVFMVHVDRRPAAAPSASPPGASAATGAGAGNGAAGSKPSAGNAADDGVTLRRGCLYLVDLAGSERVKKSGAAGTRFSELKAINLSLAALGNCIAALAKKRKHVPYRDSKLTRLLQDSLGGNAKTVLIVTVSGDPSSANESQSTLQFGSRAKQVQVCARVNEIVDYKALYAALRVSMDRGDDETTALNITIQQLRGQVAELRERVEAAVQGRAIAEAELAALCRTYNASRAAAAADGGGGASGGAAGSSPSGGDGAAERWALELEKLHAEHQRQMDDLKSRLEAQVAKHRRAANEAASRVVQLDTDLGFSRDEVLEALSGHRKAEVRLMEVEKELKDRIAELVGEVERLNEDDAARTEELAKTKQQLDRAESAMRSFKDRIEMDYVSREQVAQMEKLYTESVDKLMARVESLEAAQTRQSPASASGASRRAGRSTSGVPGRGRSTTGAAAAEPAPPRRVRTQPAPSSRTVDLYAAQASSHLSSDQARARNGRAMRTGSSVVRGLPSSSASSSPAAVAGPTSSAHGRGGSGRPPPGRSASSGSGGTWASPAGAAGAALRRTASGSARTGRVGSAGSAGSRGSAGSGGKGGTGSPPPPSEDELGMDLAEARSLLTSILSGTRGS